MQFLILLSCVTYALAAVTSAPPPGAITPAPSTFDDTGLRYDYGKALGLSILFYDAQRAGKLPDNNPIAWRGDSVLYEVDDDGHDLTGGWFDAGDHVKFNFPMAFSTWALNMGFLKFSDAYKVTGQTNMMCDMIKWPLDYFLKCWQPHTETLYTQIGDGNADHQRWASPETMTMARPAWKVNASCPGSDVAGDMVSAFASGYLVFKDICGDTAYAAHLLNAAKSLYTFATKYQGSYSRCYNDAHNFYGSNGYHDELSAAAIWMYKATHQDKYLADAKSFYSTSSPGFDWENKQPGANLLLYEVTKEQKYADNARQFITSRMPNGTHTYTPCGMVYLNRWGTARHASNIVFIALLAAEDGIMSDEFKKWALTQINYLLGDNNYHMSYEIGFGSNYPTHYHHRASSCIIAEPNCQFTNPNDNPNLLYGGLVGGPDQNDNYADLRSDYVHNEVAVDYNAGFQGALAGFIHFASTGTLPASPAAKC